METLLRTFENLSPRMRHGLEAAIVVAILLLIWLIARFLRSRRKSPEEIERLRRLDIHQHGRITSGQIVDFVESPSGEPGPCLVVYKYEIAGVDYEVAQDISALPKAIPLAKQLIGHATSLKYETQRPTNSIVACEEWCGLPQAEAEALKDAKSLSPPPEANQSPTS